MDSVTQAVLGAAVGHTIAGRVLGKKALGVGAILGTLPDLDVIFVPLYDPVQQLAVHRGLSHSLLFCVLLSLFLALIFSRKWTTQMSFSRSFMMTFACLITHVLLDACTSYGTLLLAPFSQKRVAWDLISIVDPVYTLPMLVGMIIGLWKSNYLRVSVLTGLVLSHAFLALTIANKDKVDQIFKQGAESEEIEYERMVTLPTGPGNILWYSVMQSADSLTIGEYSLWDSDNLPRFRSYARKTDLLQRVDDRNMVETMIWFSDGFFVMREHGNALRLYNLKCDMTGEADQGEAPTKFFFELAKQDGSWTLDTGMHASESEENSGWSDKFQRIMGN
ncbi:MAG: metal-dependent hydrolase [Flavobacteriales bacterium]|nr:metal-dependent hydrolase [Flavobacteriales bacterium]